MRKLGICSLVLVVILLVAAGSSFAVTRTVCASGCGYTTINGALAAANPTGDIIIVKPGIYSESVTVNKSVQILGGAAGTNKLTTFVNAPTVSDIAFMVTAPHVVISGFTVRGGINSYGVFIQSNDVRVRYCTVEKSGVGIYVFQGASNVRLSYNQVRYNTGSGTSLGYGILVASADSDIPNVYINYNQINDNDYFGVFVYGAVGIPSFGGMMIQYNTLVNNGSQDLTPPSNWNGAGFVFQNASGNITMNYNNIKATTPSGQELQVVGLATPTFAGTGNLIFSNARDTMAGTGTTLTLP